MFHYSHIGKSIGNRPVSGLGISLPHLRKCQSAKQHTRRCDLQPVIIQRNLYASRVQITSVRHRIGNNLTNTENRQFIVIHSVQTFIFRPIPDIAQHKIVGFVYLFVNRPCILTSLQKLTSRCSSEYGTLYFSLQKIVVCQQYKRICRQYFSLFLCQYTPGQQIASCHVLHCCPFIFRAAHFQRILPHGTAQFPDLSLLCQPRRRICLIKTPVHSFKLQLPQQITVRRP